MEGIILLQETTRPGKKKATCKKNLERLKEIQMEKSKQERMTPEKGELAKKGTLRMVLFFLGGEDVMSPFLYPKYVS